MSVPAIQKRNPGSMTNASSTPGSLPNPTPIPMDAAISSNGGTSSIPTAKLPRQVTSASLLQGDREIQIVHGEEIYRLSLTRQGKLILHK